MGGPWAGNEGAGPRPPTGPAVSPVLPLALWFPYSSTTPLPTPHFRSLVTRQEAEPCPWLKGDLLTPYLSSGPHSSPPSIYGLPPLT